MSKRDGAELEAFLPKVPWGWTDATEPIEEFDYLCHRCKRPRRCERMLVSRHRTVFGVSVSRAGAPRDVVRCTHCGHDMHPRDVIDLVSPRTQELCRTVVQIASEILGTAPRIELDGRDTPLFTVLQTLRDEASRPIAEQLLRDVADVARSTRSDPAAVLEAIRALGNMLMLDRCRIEEIASGRSDREAFRP